MWIFLMIAFVLVMAGAFTLGNAGARYKNKYPCAVKIFLLGYVVFAGCFVFPVLSPVSPLDFSKIYFLVVSYGVIGLGFARVYGAKKEKRVYLLSVILTIAGLLCRYLLEYGEVSNTYNFTVGNVLTYICIMPAFAVLAYHYIAEYLMSRS